MANENTTTTTSNSNSNKNQALRTTLESMGYSVNWQGPDKSITVSKDGKVSTISPSDYYINESGTAMVSPDTLSRITGYQPVRSSLESKGYTVGYNDTSKSVTVKNPTNYMTTSFTPEANWGGITYTTPERLKAIESQIAIAPEEKTASEMSANLEKMYSQLRSQAQQSYSNMSNLISQMSANNQATLLAYQTMQAEALQKVQDIINSAKNQEIPESVKLAVQELKDALNDQISELKDIAAWNGTINSGILIDQIDKLKKGELSNEQKLLAAWADQQNNQIFTATLQMANMMSNNASGYANLSSQLQNQALQAALSLEQQKLQTDTSLTQKQTSDVNQLIQWIAEQRAKRAASQQEAETAAAKMAQEWQIATLPYQYMTPYQEASLALQQQANQIRASKGTSGGSSNSLSQSEIKALNQAAQAREVANEIYAGGDPKQIEAKLLSPATYQSLIANGVDVNDLINYAYQIKYGMNKTQYDTMQGTIGGSALLGIGTS